MRALNSTPISGPEVLLQLTGTSAPHFSCTLLGIERGKMHIRADNFIEPATAVSARVGRITVSGEVAYCTRKDSWYRTCIALNSDNDRGRREPRLPIRLPGAVVALSANGDESGPGMVLDVSVSGMRLKIQRRVATGTMIFVEMASTIVVGEVRRCFSAQNGQFEAGIEVTDILSDIRPPQESPGVLKNVRRKLAEVILGQPITFTGKLK
jgi:hypothetical protein